MEHLFDSRDAASVAAAKAISCRLAAKTATEEQATLVVSGGTSPVRCFESLSTSPLDWENVHITLTDERWISADSESSNERLVRDTLLVAKASRAKFTPFYEHGTSIEARSESLNTELHALPRPFTCTLLGMGTDGHFASLFPDAVNLQAALDTNNDAYCVTVDTAASPHRRLSLTLPAVLQSEDIFLLMFGDEKRSVYECAKDPASELPIARLLENQHSPVQVFWAP